MNSSVEKPSALFLLVAIAFASAACFSDASSATDPSGSGGAGGAGGSGTGTGTGGSGGDSMPDTGAPPGGTEMIDDMEDNDGSIATVNGRVGAWYTYNDQTAAATQVPKQGDPFVMTAMGRDGSGYAANTHGSGFSVWGAGYGFNLKDPGDGNSGSAKMTYDASAYTWNCTA